MPILSEFYGIRVRMFYADHAPPHFHAIYAEHELIVGISPIAEIAGSAPARVRSMVREWAVLHQQELQENWDRCQRGDAPGRIAPLD